MSTPFDLTGKTIIITGGAGGIGEATARVCAERGAAVVIADSNAENGQRAIDGLTAAGLPRERVDFVKTDVRDPDQVQALIDFAVQKHGHLDGLVCAAGVLLHPWVPPDEFPVEDFEKTLDINIKGAFLCAKSATPHLEKSGQGVIVVVASGAGVIAASSSIAYGASKGGANGLGMTLEMHLRTRGIRVNTLCPGNIITPMKMSVDIAQAQRQNRPVEEAIRHAEENYGTPPGVARIIAFMLSEEADYLRGALFTR